MTSRGQATEFRRASCERPHTPPSHRRVENPVRIGLDWVDWIAFRVGANRRKSARFKT